MGHTIAHGSRVGLGQNSSWREFIPPAIKPRYFAVAIKPGGPALRWHRSTAPDSLQKPDAPAGLPRVTGSMSAVCCLQRDRRQMLHMCGFHLGHPTRAHRSQAIARPSCWRQRPNTRNPRRRLWRCDGTLLGPSRTRDEAAIVYRNRSPSSPARAATPPLGAS